MRVTRAMSFGLMSGIVFALLMVMIIAADSVQAASSPQETAQYILCVGACSSVFFTIVSLLIDTFGG